VIALNGIGNRVLRLVGIDRRIATGERYYTPQELQLVFQESQDAGALPAESARLAREIFEFGDLEARQVMAPRVRVVGVAAGTRPEAVEEVLRRAPHTRYPVYTGDLDNVLGMVHVKDLLRLVLAGETVAAQHVRTMPTVPETAPLDSVLAAMSRERAQMALVIDEHGGTAGIITLQDLFEEVVGPVDDRDEGAAMPTPEGGDRVRVPGTARLDEVGERFSVPLRHPEVDSVSGLILVRLGRPPRVGDQVRFGGLRFEVTKVMGFGVGECAVSRLPPA
jgi:CBS domain containing-hemolysin-like protein